jgi:hypothetical protein
MPPVSCTPHRPTLKTVVTVDYPRDEVQALVRFAARQVEDLDRHAVIVKVKNTRAGTGHGRVYPCVQTQADYRAGHRWLVTLALGAPARFPVDAHPYHLGRTRTAIIGQFADWRELLVFQAAHELQHIADYQCRRKATEDLANFAGCDCLRRYRREVARQESPVQSDPARLRT